MYGGYNYDIERLNRMKDEINNQIKSYQSLGQNPINNFINTNQQPNKDMIEWRILNENEEVDNLYVTNKTVFVGENLMIVKGVDGSLEKWQVKKIYPIDKKDEKINMLEEEIRKLKEVINNEHKQFNSTNEPINQSYDNVNGVIEPEPKTNHRAVAKQIKSGTSTSNSGLLQQE